MKEFRKIASSFKRRFFYFHRTLCEKCGDFSHSKPYPPHDRLLEQIEHIKNGFFVECGGNDGYFQDPTYYLEKIGWAGIIVEPLAIAEICKKYRPRSIVYQYAITAPEQANTMIDFIDVNAMSVVADYVDDEKEWVATGERAQGITAQRIKVPTRTVQQIIDDYFAQYKKRDIDLLVVDIEGYEINALKGLDFKKNSPKYLLIECHTEEREAEINTFLKEKGYNKTIGMGNKDFLFSKKIL